MKNSKLLFPILLLASMIAAGGCSKDKDKDKDIEEIVNIETPEAPDEPEAPEPPSNPPQNVGDYYKAFIGQWQEIAQGNEHHPELPTTGNIVEFLPDGTYPVVFVDSDGAREGKVEYRVDAEFLYFDSGKDPDGRTSRYTFTGPDTLRLDYVAGAITQTMFTPSFHIYKRLESTEP